MQQFCVSCLPPSGRRSWLHCVWKREEPPSHRLLSAASWAWAHRKVFPQGEWGGNGGLRMEQGQKSWNTETENGLKMCAEKKKYTRDVFMHLIIWRQFIVQNECNRAKRTFLPRFSYSSLILSSHVCMQQFLGHITDVSSWHCGLVHCLHCDWRRFFAIGSIIID